LYDLNKAIIILADIPHLLFYRTIASSCNDWLLH